MSLEVALAILGLLAKNVPAIADSVNHFLAERRAPSESEWKELLAEAGVPFEELWPEVPEREV